MPVTAYAPPCHAASQFRSTPRSSSRWEQFFEECPGLAANGTDDLTRSFVNYFPREI